MMAGNWVAAVGVALLAHAVLLYWSFGFLTRFGRDGTPRDFVQAGRPDALRAMGPIFRRFSYGGTVLAICGGLTLVYSFIL